MLDVRELERQWLRYKIKRYLPYGVLSISLLLIAVVLANIDFSKKSELPQEAQKELRKTTSAAKQIAQEKKNNTTTVALSKPSVIQSEPAQIQPPNEQTAPAAISSHPLSKKKPTIYTSIPRTAEPSKILKPSMDFLRKMKDNSVLPESGPIAPPKPQASYYSTTQSSSPSNNENKMEEKQQTKEAQKTKVEIKISKTSKKELQDIIKRFKKNNNPVLGVFIAKKYYEMKDYHKAYNYALITNQIDSTIEDSWIIFAKSLVKLGQKERAIKTLKAYIKTSHSSKAKILLDNILTGKFK